MATNIIKSRVHRILRRMERYRAANPGDAERLGLTAQLEPGEELICFYINPLGTTTHTVAVTTAGLFLCQEGAISQHFKYRDVQELDLGPEEKASRSITVFLCDGSTRVVHVAGGEGRLRDSLSFLRFLQRAVDDIQMGRSIRTRKDDADS